MVNMHAKPSVALLREINLLHIFDDNELQQLIQIGMSASYEAHGNIIVEGELSWGLYVILEGMVGIYKTNKLTGDNYDVGQLRAGNFFGEMSLVDDAARSATVRALTDCHLFYLSKDVFTQFLDRHSGLKARFYENCILTLVHRLREVDENYVISQYQLWRVALKKESA